MKNGTDFGKLVKNGMSENPPPPPPLARQTFWEKKY